MRNLLGDRSYLRGRSTMGAEAKHDVTLSPAIWHRVHATDHGVWVNVYLR